jgi:hypothetical protein
MSSMRVEPLARVDERWQLDSPFALRTNECFERIRFDPIGICVK